MNTKSRAQREMDRRLFLAGMPPELADLVATSVFDRERLPRRGPIPALSVTESFQTVQEWLAVRSGPATRASVEPLFGELFAVVDPYEWARLGPPARPDRTPAPDLKESAPALVDSALKVAASAADLPDSAPNDAIHRFAAATRVALTGHLGTGVPSTDPYRDPFAVVYRVAWDELDRTDLGPEPSTRERLTIAYFFQVMWGWLQSFEPSMEVPPPREAMAKVQTSDHLCLRCGTVAPGQSHDDRRFVSGPCTHEWVSTADRDRLWEQPPADPEDLARRILCAANSCSGTKVEFLKSDAPMPGEEEARIRLLDMIRTITGFELPPQASTARSLGDLFEILASQMPPIPTTPYAGDRIEAIFSGVGVTPAAPVKSSSTGRHRPSAACLGGRVLEFAPDEALARGIVALHLNAINAGRCPRCGDELDPMPAGSRVTDCRCIPVCTACGNDEPRDNVRLADWPIEFERSEPDEHTDDTLQAHVFLGGCAVGAGDPPTESERTDLWSYPSWPSLLLGRLPTDGLRVWLRPGHAKRFDDAKTADVRRRILGSLLGGAIADALGEPIEFMSLREIRQMFGHDGVTGYWDRSPHPGAFSDDTQMTLFTAEGLIRTRQRWAGSDYNWWSPMRCVAPAYVRWLATQGIDPHTHHPELNLDYLYTGWLITVPSLWRRMAPGNTCLNALRNPPLGSVGNPVNNSKGCGGVMRVASAGFVPFDNYSFDLGCKVAALTHGHPSGYLAAGAMAHLLSLLRDGKDLRDAVDATLDVVRKRPDSGELVAALEGAVRKAAQGQPSPERVESFGRGAVAEEALAIAVYAALVAKDFRTGVLLAVNHSGDSDSTGSIAGQILGAMYGVEGIPDEWRDGLESGHVVDRVANDFVDAFYTERVLPNNLYPAW